MRVDPVHYYYKDTATGVEMNFSKLYDWGWTIGFPNSTIEEAVSYKGHIPWPELSEEEQKIVDSNYEKLYEDLRRDEE